MTAKIISIKGLALLKNRERLCEAREWFLTGKFEKGDLSGQHGIILARWVEKRIKTNNRAHRKYRAANLDVVRAKQRMYYKRKKHHINKLRKLKWAEQQTLKKLLNGSAQN